MALVADIIAEARRWLLDAQGVQYASEELGDYVHDAELAVASVRPDEAVAESDLRLSAGTRQDIPADGLRLRSVINNRGRFGSLADGPGIRLVPRGLLDDIAAGGDGYDFRSEEPGQVVFEYLYDEREPKRFDVTPPMADGDTFIRVVYEKAFSNYTWVSGALTPADQEISVSDKYKPAILEWVYYRALSRPDDVTEESVDGADHYQRFFDMLGVTITSDNAASLKGRSQLAP